MDGQQAVDLQALLEGVPLPADKAALLAYAVGRRAEPLLLAALRAVPDRTYKNLDDVVEELVRVT